MISIPIQPIPITMATVAVYLSGVIVGPKYGAISQLVYLLLVLVGLPFTSKLIGGVAVFVGPTAGFLIGYVPMAAVIGLIHCYFKNRFDKNSTKVFGLDTELASQVEGFTQGLSFSTSDYSGEHTWTAENILNLGADVFT